MNKNLLTNVLDFVWNLLKAVQTLVFGLLSLGLIIVLLVVLGSNNEPEISDNGALLLNPKGLLVEQKTAVSPQDLLRSGELPKEALVKDMVDALRIAKEDERIALVVLSLDGLQGDYLPKLERVARAIEDFKSSGKKVIAVGNNYNQSAILLAVQADEVLMNPEGQAFPEGYGMYRTYYKTLLENFDVSINLFKVGKYKSAVEPYFRDSMSDEDKEARLGILNNWWDAYTTAVETNRGFPAGRLNQLLGNASSELGKAGGNMAQLALATGLIDRLVTADEKRAYLIEVAGKDEESGEYQHTSYLDYLRVMREPETQKDNKIAVITAVGSIVDGNAGTGSIGSFSLTKLIREARKDEKVKAIVLRVDSGGGSKTASEYIRRELESVQESGIPVVASMGSLAASGGYWISATADEIWALPTTLTGSIGIFGLIPTFEKTLARYGVYADGVGTTPVADGVSLERGISPIYAELIQVIIESGYDQFLSVVAKGRNMSTEAVNEIAQGRVWSGEKALELGLVDHLGDLEKAIEAAARLAKVEDYSVWHVEAEVSTKDELLRELMTSVSFDEVHNSSDPVSIVMRKIKADLNFLGQLNDPRGAYVICGSCPVDQ